MNELKKNTFPLIYAVMVWLLYAGLYKYAHYIKAASLPNPEHNPFPYPLLLIYALVMTVYTIPFYRYIGPKLLHKRKYLWLATVTILYFILVPKYWSTGVSWLFMQASTEPLYHFYQQQFTHWHLQIVLTDCLIFLSLTFVYHAFTVESSKRLLEKEHFRLQVEALKAQLNPHFLFNTLNSIYGMSLSHHPDTPGFILRMSDMMRYILYDGREATVPLEKDLEFLENYIAMEQKRYPDATISFSIENDTQGKKIVPLLLIPFLENSFKHGAHRISDTGSVTGAVVISGHQLNFSLVNDKIPVTVKQKSQQAGGVGLENVRKRLDVYYPGAYTLSIDNAQQYKVSLCITLSS